METPSMQCTIISGNRTWRADVRRGTQAQQRDGEGQARNDGAAFPDPGFHATPTREVSFLVPSTWSWPYRVERTIQHGPGDWEANTASIFFVVRVRGRRWYAKC